MLWFLKAISFHIYREHQEEDQDFVEEEVDREEVVVVVVVIVAEVDNIEEEIVEEEVEMLHLRHPLRLSIHPLLKDLKKKQSWIFQNMSINEFESNLLGVVK